MNPVTAATRAPAVETDWSRGLQPPQMPASPLKTASGYPDRFPVSPASMPWERACPGYTPVFYEAPRVLQQDRTVTPGGWADPATITPEQFRALKEAGTLRSFEGEVRLDAETGRPLNPIGRTGITGRGLLGRWGANQAADALLTRVSESGEQLEALLIQRESGEWAIPGGMLDDGEDAFDAARRELLEEASVDVTSHGRLVYQGLADGPRVTDNAWIETSLYHFHLDADNPAARQEPKGNNEVEHAGWFPVSDMLVQSLYANHGELLAMAISQMRARGELPIEHVTNSHFTVRHSPLLTSFSGLSGRIGIFGGTFDPVHNGHIEAAHSVVAAKQLDALVFLPTAQNPMKAHRPGAVARERVEMLTAVAAENPRFFVSPLEVRGSGVSYTVESLRAIRAELPDGAELFMLLGADCVMQLPEWDEVQEIRSLATTVPVSRPGVAEPDFAALAPVLGLEFAQELADHFVRQTGRPESSTEIRALLQHGDSAGDMLPSGVREYIASREIAALIPQVTDRGSPTG